MNATLLPSSITLGAEPSQFLTSFLINGVIAIDAGSLGLLGSTDLQAKVKHVFLTHTHMDHLASLPVFLENVFEAGAECPTVYGSRGVLECLQQDVFNDRIWPDFVRMSRETPDSPFLRLVEIHEGQTVQAEGLQITPVAVDHLVPSLGLIVEGPDATVVVASDTGPTHAIWEAANNRHNLKAVFLEAAFPDSLAWLADAARHLTPRLFAAEVQKIKPGTTVMAVHIKPRYLEQISAELAALGLPMVEICEPGRLYEF